MRHNFVERSTCLGRDLKTNKYSKRKGKVVGSTKFNKREVKLYLRLAYIGKLVPGIGSLRNMGS